MKPNQKKEMATALVCHHFDRFHDNLINELKYIEDCVDSSKDIIIPVHDQVDYLKDCVQSIRDTTQNYHLYIWDNASGPETEAYLKDLMYQLPDQVTVMRSETNLGYIYPNNEMAQWGTGEYIILLNSDTKVYEGWDKALLGLLQSDPKVAQVGYLGGLLGEQGDGGRAEWGWDIDYVLGFCSCFPRAIYNRFGLFDPQLRFAYCEDSDFSIRLQEAGYKIYALHLMLVNHFENKTIKAVAEEGVVDCRTNFAYNHEVLRGKWQDYLRHRRVDVRQNGLHFE
jgi:GT2 family glycosyltransferase